MDNHLSAPEAASILGISLATLYSYVSRGLLTPTVANASRSKRYPREAVLHLAARKADGKRGGHSAAAAMNWGVPVLETRISHIADGQLYYRGHNAVSLAEKATLEMAAGILWSETPSDLFTANPFTPAPGLPETLYRFTMDMAPLERAGTIMHSLAHTLPALDGSTTPVLDYGPMLMRLLAAILLGTQPSALPLHEQLAREWGITAVQAELIRSALVLLADHELNASTFAVRCVASTGASLPATLSTGLAALSGPRHGGGSASVKQLLDSMRAAPRLGRTAAGYFSEDGSAPMGFRHRLYPDGDPRAAYLLNRLSTIPVEAKNAAEVIGDCIEEGKRRGYLPNADFALAAMQFAFGLPDSAALTLFALARSAGWIAHAAEQVAADTLIRPRSRYVGRL